MIGPATITHALATPQKRAAWGAGLIAAAVLVLLGLAKTGLAPGLGKATDTPPPGLSAGVSALSANAPVSGPSEVTDWVDNSAAPSLSISSVTAEQRLRRLATGLGPQALDLYALDSPGGNGDCVYVTTYGGACIGDNAASDIDPGILWVAGGGSDTSHEIFAALVADDVTGVSLKVGSSAIGLTTAPNVVFGTLPANTQTGTATVSHSDGVDTYVTFDFTDSAIPPG